ncbi:MAG: Gfo/Idh/MocA family oxidoreductase [Nitrososphaerota archaeon]|nr:Gfo/Idh/MocA family oxidoreductase [Candidatus Calditenuaceae archaeon]MDW8072688.1 Gfo/Idh/MocA family oxidoreductase [Nitrososphaerota archaeon]
MSSGRVKIAVIGAGFWGRNHARVFSEIEGADLQAVVDIDASRAQQIAKKFNIPKIYTDYKRLLDAEELDAVSICTPTITHAEIALECIRRGCVVLVEKPMASTLREALEILDAVKSFRGKLMVGFIERFNPAVRYMLSAISEGVIGTPLTIAARRIGPWPQRIGDVGVVKDVAIHDIDLTHFFFGSMPTHLYATGGALRHSYEDYVQALMYFDDVRSASIEANWLSSKKKRDMRITGTEGVANIEFLTGEVIIEKPEHSISPTINYVEPLKSELTYFVEQLRKSGELAPGPVEGVLSLAVSEAILASMRSRATVYLDNVLGEWGISRSELKL